MRQLLFALLFWGSTIFALVRGGGTERSIAIIFALGVLGSPLVVRVPGASFAGLELNLLLVDVAVLLGFAAVALRSEKFWPLWATAMQGVVVLSHLASALGPEIMRLAYAGAVKFWSYPQLILMVIATWRHARESSPLDAGRS